MQLRARAAIAEAEKLAIEHRLDHATAEGERKDAVIRSVKLEAEQMTYNFNDAKRQLSEVEAKFLEELNRQRQRLDPIAIPFVLQRSAAQRTKLDGNQARSTLSY